jgi:hypothetical protein
MCCNAWYNCIHNPLLSCLISEDIMNWNTNNSCFRCFEWVWNCVIVRRDYGLIVFENGCWVECLGDFRGWRQHRVGEQCNVSSCLVCAAQQKWLEWCKERERNKWVM